MRHKQFGQRPGSNATRDNLRAIQGVSYESTHEEAERGASKLRRTVFWIGAAALMIGIYVGTRGSGQGLSQYWKKNSAPAVVEAYVPIGAKDVALEKANNTCRSRGDASGRDNTMRQAAAYVSCLAAESPKRLCQVSHRTHFLAAVKNYYRLQAKNRDVKASPEVVEAIKAVVTDGYIPRRDVAAAQSELEAVLRGVEPRRSGC